MDHILILRYWIFSNLLLLIIAEIIWSYRKDKKAYQIKDTLANTCIFIGFQLSKFLFAGVQVSILTLLSKLAIFRVDPTVGSFILTFVLADFMYYWYHRISHKWKLLWAFHEVHHSSTLMNLSTAYRLNWFSALVSPFFFFPLVLIGLPVSFIAVSFALNLLYQFFLHTEAIGKLGPLEGIIDTPSAHRVHHGSNSHYIDKNFGGVFMVWDRLFGTYEPEREKVRYGLTSGFVSHNPFKLIFHGFFGWFRSDRKVSERNHFHH